ncbi:DUF3786 domain-containing protein [Chloroflexota bacterium]
MSYDAALEKAMAEMKGIVPYAAANKSGTEFDGDKFRLPLFERSFLVHYPSMRVEEENVSVLPPQWLQLILLHYLLQAQGNTLAEEWATYRQLPGASFFEARFRKMSIDSLLRAFGHDLESFKRAALALKGTPMSRTGDAAFRFMALPRIPMACILYLGEDEMPPSINVLFDAAAPTYLPTEDLSYLGLYLALGLKQHKNR